LFIKELISAPVPAQQFHKIYPPADMDFLIYCCTHSYGFTPSTMDSTLALYHDPEHLRIATKMSKAIIMISKRIMDIEIYRQSTQLDGELPT